MDRGQFTILGIGEVLWDVLPTGRMPGGAPANFAYIATQLGNNGSILSRVGNDDDGRELIAALGKRGLETNYIQTDDTHATGRVEVLLKGDMPEYEILKGVAWDELEVTEEWLRTAANCDAICFGSLAQRSERSRATIRNIVAITSPSSLRIFDINLRQSFYSRDLIETSLQAANIVKMNRDELELISEMFGSEGPDETSSLFNLKAKFELHAACVTLGDAGSILICNEAVSIDAGVKIDPVDTIGAGDAFTAAMVHGMLRGWDADRINRSANEVGAFVASQKGAMPTLPASVVEQ